MCWPFFLSELAQEKIVAVGATTTEEAVGLLPIRRDARNPHPGGCPGFAYDVRKRSVRFLRALNDVLSVVDDSPTSEWIT